MTELTEHLDKAIIAANPANSKSFSKLAMIGKAMSYLLRKDESHASVVQRHHDDLTNPKCWGEGQDVAFIQANNLDSKFSQEELDRMCQNSLLPHNKDKLILVPMGQPGLFPHAVLIAIKNGRACIIDPNHYSCKDTGVPARFDRVKFAVQGRTDGRHCARYVALIADDLAKRHHQSPHSALHNLVAAAQRDRSHTPYTEADLVAVEAFTMGHNQEYGTYTPNLEPLNAPAPQNPVAGGYVQAFSTERRAAANTPPTTGVYNSTGSLHRAATSAGDDSDNEWEDLAADAAGEPQAAAKSAKANGSIRSLISTRAAAAGSPRSSVTSGSSRRFIV